MDSVLLNVGSLRTFRKCSAKTRSARVLEGLLHPHCDLDLPLTPHVTKPENPTLPVPTTACNIYLSFRLLRKPFIYSLFLIQLRLACTIPPLWHLYAHMRSVCFSESNYGVRTSFRNGFLGHSWNEGQGNWWEIVIRYHRATSSKWIILLFLKAKPWNIENFSERKLWLQWWVIIMPTLNPCLQNSVEN